MREGCKNGGIRASREEWVRLALSGMIMTILCAYLSCSLIATALVIAAVVLSSRISAAERDGSED